MQDVPPPSGKPRRIDVVDWLRGVAVALMIMAHGFDAWLLPAAKTGWLYGIIRIASGIPARLFLLLVGVSAAIQFEGWLAQKVDSRAMRARLLKRGVQVLALAYLFRLQEWVLSRFYDGWQSLFRVDILNAIGVSMLIVGVVSTPRGGRRQMLASLALAAVFLGLGTIVGPAHFPAWLPRPLTSYLGGERPMAWFPLFPWGSWSLVGVALGHLWAKASQEPRRLVRCYLLTFFAGLVLALAVAFIRTIDPNAIHYPSEAIAQMGPGTFFHRLGIIGMLGGAGFFWCLALRGRFSPLRQLGRTSLLIYWIHVEFCYGSLVYALRGRFHIGGAALLVLSLTGFMLVVSVLKTRFSRPAQSWLEASFRKAGPA